MTDEDILADITKDGLEDKLCAVHHELTQAKARVADWEKKAPAGYSCNGVNLYGTSESIDAAKQAFDEASARGVALEQLRTQHKLVTEERDTFRAEASELREELRQQESDDVDGLHYAVKKEIDKTKEVLTHAMRLETALRELMEWGCPKSDCEHKNTCFQPYCPMRDASGHVGAVDWSEYAV